MTEFDKILEITSNNTVKLTQDFKDEIHKELALGNTRYMCRHGALSDGHDVITDAHRYYSAKRNAWHISNEIVRMRAQAKIAQADLLEAENEVYQADSNPKELRAQAAVEIAKQKLTELLVMVEDSMRQLDEYAIIINELKGIVREKYPNGIEQASEDIWTAVAEYKIGKRKFGLNENLTNIPLEKELKARIGWENKCPDLALWHIVNNKDRLLKDFNGNIEQMLSNDFDNRLKIVTKEATDG